MHLGKTQVWNRGGLPGCDSMQVAAQRMDRTQESGVEKSHEQGIRVLGIPIGDVDFVHAQLQSKTEKHRVLHERHLSVQDLQSAWLLFFFCANARATYSLRGIPRSEVADFAEAHDEATWQCFMRLLSLPLNTVGRVWIVERHEVSCPSPLGELGGQFAHYPLPTSSPR